MKKIYPKGHLKCKLDIFQLWGGVPEQVGKFQLFFEPFPKFFLWGRGYGEDGGQRDLALFQPSSSNQPSPLDITPSPLLDYDMTRNLSTQILSAEIFQLN